MSSNVFTHLLQYGTAGVFGKNLNLPPSRIVPISFRDLEYLENKNNKKILQYQTPNQEVEYVLCEQGAPLFEPAAYFQPPHTFLQSFLYLTSPDFHQIVSRPQERDQFLIRYLKKVLTSEPPSKKRTDSKKLLQHLLLNNNDTPIGYDTDPCHSPYFACMCNAMLPENTSIIVVHSDRDGNFRGTTPSTLLPDLTQTSQVHIVLLQLASGYYAPYGIIKPSLKE